MLSPALLPRGVRNANPGNICKLPAQPFQGLAPPEAQTDPEFYVFADYNGYSANVWGVRAMAVVLLAYELRHQIHTIRQITGRYADRPHIDDPIAYAQAVSKFTGIGMDDVIDLRSGTILQKIVAAMISVENGGWRYAPFVISQGVALAYIADEIKDLDLATKPGTAAPVPPAPVDENATAPAAEKPAESVVEVSHETPAPAQNAAVQDTTADHTETSPQPAAST